ncbi:Maf family nucleotide pyrophosphatase [Echinicola jeungdonensis]|uniref:dTTP/UTP pyrophosphatase n=1 Tax=Echinicola jeungdonensis TaxID=709343 RepID=A0ABV5J2Y4_9BACT|nr:Maf family nucleotide pyrophosphatase [Echinicola jeungdonensis]MDN3668018.1 Maf family nucleotide pyrophosphatase [Echinicola jeungdonensis]
MNKLLPPYKIILASKSPRRQEILQGLDIDFEIRTKEVNEDFPEDLPQNQVARYLAEKKAAAFVDEMGDNEIIITSDTTVLINGQVLNKPKDREEAIQMLKQLSGNVHHVISGVCMMGKNKKIAFDDLTEVHLRNLSIDEIEAYIDNYHPFDKAGSYGVQEWIGYAAVFKLIGSFYTVMGLPVHRVYEELKNWKSNY